MFKYKKWKQAISYNEWFEAIKEDIKHKYKIDNPKFSIDNIFLETQKFEKWKEEFMIPPFFWVQYKNIKDNIFELKPYSPWPTYEVLTEIINNFLEKLIKGKNAKYFCINKYYEIFRHEHKFINEPGETIYTISEAKVELKSLFRRGFSRIELTKKTTVNTGKREEKVYHLHVSQDSIENMLKTKYLQLEYSDKI
ncbi:hypothetical protein ACFLYH_03605 [Candidatus Dependentiae bacterium]